MLSENLVIQKRTKLAKQKKFHTRNVVKPTKMNTEDLKKQIKQYHDKNGFLSWSAKKKRYIILGTNEPKNGIVACPQCEIGQLMIIRSKKTNKRFMGCSNYYNGCTASSPLLQKARLRTTKRTCEFCKWPIILFRYSRKAKWVRRCSNFYCKSIVSKS